MFGRRRTGAARAPARASDWRSFDRVAEAYDRFRAPIHEPPAHDLVEALGPPAPGGLLDVGAGTGVAAAAAQTAGWTPVVAIDRSFPMVSRGRSRGVGHPMAADAIDLPFRDGTFGAIAAAFSLHIFPKYDTALFDMIRVLRPRGRLGTATWVRQNDEFSRTWRSVADAYATKELVDDAIRRAAPWEERFSDSSRLEETLRDAGIREVQIERREYRSTVSVADYLAGRETTAAGRFLHGMLGDALWERFRTAVEQEFRSRFPDPLGDSYEVLLAVGTSV
jgi:ubiquinone/menaquinone biosynthesis C-methylase UbiE